MFNRFNPDLYPRIGSYAEAKALFDSTAPVRGRSPYSYPVIPLRTDRSQPDNFYIREHVISVTFHYNNSLAIEWHKDGRICITTWSHPHFRQFAERIVEGLTITRVGDALCYNGDLCRAVRSVTLRRNANGELKLTDEYKSIPMYTSHKYAPAFEKLGEKIRQWRKLHKALLADNPDMVCKEPPVDWKFALDARDVVDAEWAATYTPPAAWQTASFRLYTDGLPIGNRRPTTTISFDMLYLRLREGAVRQA